MHGNKPETGESFAQRMQQGKSKAFNHRRRFPEATDTSQAPNKPAQSNQTSTTSTTNAPPAKSAKRGVPFQRKGSAGSTPKGSQGGAPC